MPDNYKGPAQFLSTPSARRATAAARAAELSFEFLSTPSARRATRAAIKQVKIPYQFLSTPSARRATGTSMFTTLLSGDFYPRPPRGGRPPSGRNTPDTPNFYPRPPRGGRLTARGSITPGINFYPRPPRGGRPTSAASRSVLSQFLSTPSARRATCRSLRPTPNHHNFYPRPPRGGRPCSELRW